MKTKLALAVIVGIALIFIISIAGCGSVVEMDADAGAAGTTGSAGSTAPDAGHDVLAMGAAGRTGGAGGTGAAGTTACAAPLPTVEACRASGVALVTAEFWCSETYDDTKSLSADNCVDGTMTGYYAGMSCPFNVAIATTAGWTGPAPEHTGSIITNAGSSASTAWRNTDAAVYCCDGLIVKKLDRCPTL